VLVNAGLVRECIAANNRFVRLHRDAGDLLEQLARGIKFLAGDRCLIGISIRTHSQRHHNFFERSVAGAFTNAVDRTFHLPRAIRNCDQGVGNGEPKVIMAMSGNRCFLNSTHPLANVTDQVTELCRDRITNGVWDIQGRGSGLDYGFEHLKQKLRIGSGRILGRKFDVLTVSPRQSNRLGRLFQALLARDAELMGQMDIGGRKKDVNAWPDGSVQCLSRAFDIVLRGTRERGNNRTRHSCRNRLNRRKIPIRSNRETGFDHVHPEAVELPRKPRLFMHIHAAAGRLFAVPQSGVKNCDPRVHLVLLEIYLNVSDTKSESKAYYYSEYAKNV